MDAMLSQLIAAAVTFVGSHFALSHPLRAPLVSRLGAGGFLALYSLVSLTSFAWMVWAYLQIGNYGEPLWTGYDEVSWTAASLLTLVASVLLLGSFAGNPALPDPNAAENARKAPAGVFTVTRHPMMWGFALWAMAHIAVSPVPRTLVVASAILILALVGAHLQDRKKEVLMGEAWSGWEARTTYWPKWSNLPRAGAVLWVIALIFWLAATWAHVWLAYVPAGVWRWVG